MRWWRFGSHSKIFQVISCLVPNDSTLVGLEVLQALR